MKNRLLMLSLMISILNLKGQENRTTFGLQYKPIIPAKYFNSSYTNGSSGYYYFKLTPKYSNSFGMVLRHKINNTFSIESGLNYIQRNYKLTMSNSNQNINDFTHFGMRSYEIPIQFLTYVRASEFWHLNVAFGISHNALASDILSFGERTEYLFQNTYRRNGGYRSLLANIGMEYQTEKRGHYYIGTSLHLPWTEISRIYPEYDDGNNTFNDENFNDKFFLEMSGNFITIDLRYFFPE
tara:strand:- start:2520 stop:3236 length:717 start_codon:yes stop_codon:yes gene_type:complete